MADISTPSMGPSPCPTRSGQCPSIPFPCGFMPYKKPWFRLGVFMFKKYEDKIWLLLTYPYSWWFGTWLLCFHSVGNFITPTDERHHFSEELMMKPPSRSPWYPDTPSLGRSWCRTVPCCTWATMPSAPWAPASRAARPRRCLDDLDDGGSVIFVGPEMTTMENYNFSICFMGKFVT